MVRESAPSSALKTAFESKKFLNGTPTGHQKRAKVPTRVLSCSQVSVIESIRWRRVGESIRSKRHLYDFAWVRCKSLSSNTLRMLSRTPCFYSLRNSPQYREKRYHHWYHLSWTWRAGMGESAALDTVSRKWTIETVSRKTPPQNRLENCPSIWMTRFLFPILPAVEVGSNEFAFLKRPQKTTCSGKGVNFA